MVEGECEQGGGRMIVSVDKINMLYENYLKFECFIILRQRKVGLSWESHPTEQINIRDGAGWLPVLSSNKGEE